MHPNPSFRKTSVAQNIEAARARAFGSLALNANDGPLISHIPFILSPDGGCAEFHLVRSNPIVSALKSPQRAVIALICCDGYISPDWYAQDDFVPTWNYVAIHLRGVAQLGAQDTLEDLLARQSHTYESRLKSKPPWTMDKLSQVQKAKMMRMIVPVRMQIETIDGTWKLGQNKGDDARVNAAKQVQTGIGHERAQLQALMIDPPA